MALRNRRLITIIFISMLEILSLSAKLPTFVTKQDTKNIRFLSYDGSMTYYQRSNGSLQLSTNYKVSEVLKLSEKSQYLVFVSPNKKYTLISHQKNPFSRATSRKTKNLYLSQYGSTKTKRVGLGIFISFLGKKSEYFSYYLPTLKKIVIVKSSNINIKKEIQVAAGLNPYFIPQVVMINNQNILFSDLNAQGIPGLRIFNFEKSLSTLFYKAPSFESKLKICAGKSELFIWESSYNKQTPGTRITKVPYKSFNRDKQTFVYQSEENDRGNLICHKKGSLFFIKKHMKQNASLFDVAQFNLKTSKTKLISDLGYVSSLINLDGRLLIPFQGKLYGLDDKSDMSKADNLGGEDK